MRGVINSEHTQNILRLQQTAGPSVEVLTTTQARAPNDTSFWTHHFGMLWLSDVPPAGPLNLRQFIRGRTRYEIRTHELGFIYWEHYWTS